MRGIHDYFITIQYCNDVDIKYISVTFELQHNVCGRRVYAEGTVDAILFLAQVKAHKAKKRLYSMIDVLESGNLI